MTKTNKVRLNSASISVTRILLLLKVTLLVLISTLTTERKMSVVCNEFGLLISLHLIYGVATNWVAFPLVVPPEKKVREIFNPFSQTR